ncbi:hypothetical protein T492DRAFT_872555 [Pavlovales sp. CCMP2436]|nr:hypothetical protein T492DRAFT_872555 [Pavlovales sp. CCMP2436]
MLEPLSFIRVPRAGEAAIELAFGEAGVLFGETREIDQQEPLYPSVEPRGIFGQVCAAPTQFVPGSFTVVRNPYSRLVAYGCQLLADYFSSGCEQFRKAVSKLPDTPRARPPPAAEQAPPLAEALGYSSVEQWAYIRHAKWVLPFEMIDRSIPALASLYGLCGVRLAIPPRNAEADVNASVTSSGSGHPSGGCPVYIRQGACITRVLRQRLVRRERQAFSFFAHEQLPAAWPRAPPLAHLLRTLLGPNTRGVITPAVPHELCAPEEMRSARVLWLYWAQGWHLAPALMKMTAIAWRAYHPLWLIRKLDEQTVPDWLDLLALYTRLPESTTAAYSDVLRTELPVDHKMCTPVTNLTRKVFATVPLLQLTLRAPKRRHGPNTRDDRRCVSRLREGGGDSTATGTRHDEAFEYRLVLRRASDDACTDSDADVTATTISGAHLHREHAALAESTVRPLPRAPPGWAAAAMADSAVETAVATEASLAAGWAAGWAAG